MCQVANWVLAEIQSTDTFRELLFQAWAELEGIWCAEFHGVSIVEQRCG